ncbi:hypothetical protein [Nocardia sp. SC052]|uniref:hypothetical protein n=1 Tax=Nocardia sichangensis TaxID=3385975 RepID=UPI0039A3623A
MRVTPLARRWGQTRLKNLGPYVAERGQHDVPQGRDGPRGDLDDFAVRAGDGVAGA